MQNWIAEQEAETSCHVRDWMRSRDFIEDMEGIEEMRIISKSHSTSTVEDEQRNRSTVFRGDDGKWKCLRCQRYRCEHVLYVKRANPELPEPPTLDIEDYADLIDD